MPKTLLKLLGGSVGAGVLLAAAAGSVLLACLGAEDALAAMKSPAGLVVAGVLAAAPFGASLVRGRAALFSAAGVLHLGFALVLGGWVYDRLAAPEGGYLELRAGQTGTVSGEFNLAVREFTIDRWPDTGTVRQYRCAVAVLPPDRTEAESVPGAYDAEISVNHPLVKDGWWVYQSSYKEVENPHTGEPVYFTILECVKDVGLPFAAAGGLLLLVGACAYMLKTVRAPRDPAAALPPAGPVRKTVRGAYAAAFAGAVTLLVRRGLATGHPPMQNMYEFLMCTLALLPVLTWISAKTDREDTLAVDASLMAFVAMPVLFFMDPSVKRLMPALQSPFFIPHVGAYVIGYVLLVRAALGAGRRLVGVGFALLTLGLVLGAAWGKVCWGHWWQFDPKEMWSLATWFVYLAYFHLRPRLSPRAERAFLVAGAVMVVLTLTWINLSRMFTGMHSYA